MSKEGLLPGSNARVYRDGAPGEGVLVSLELVPVGSYLCLRNLPPGTYAVQDEAGNVEEFVVDAFSEAAYVPVQGAALEHGGLHAGSAGPGQSIVEPMSTQPDPGVERLPAPRAALKPAVVDPDSVRVPGASGSAHIGDPPESASERKAQPTGVHGGRPTSAGTPDTEPKPDASERSAGKQAAKAAERHTTEIKAVDPEDVAPEPEKRPQRAKAPAVSRAPAAKKARARAAKKREKS